MKNNLPKKLQNKIASVQKASERRAAEIARRQAEGVVHRKPGKKVKA